MSSPVFVLFFIVVFCSTMGRVSHVNCSTCAPNIIAEAYPNNATGTINATNFVLTVPLDYARSLPVVLTHAYTRFSIHPMNYPLVFETAFESDVRYRGINAVPDEPSLRLTFPFIGLLEDNSTCFRYISYIYLSSEPITSKGSETYGINTIPSRFDPKDEPYMQSSENKHYRYVSANSSQKLSKISSQTMTRRTAASVYFHPSNHKGQPSSSFLS